MLENNPEVLHEKAMLKNAHRFVFITMVIAYIVLCVLAVYAVSVLDRNNVVRQIDTNVNSIISYLEQGAETGELVQKEFLDEYRTKTKVVSVMITDVSSLEEDETVLEKIRVAVDADEVSVFSHSGNIVATTATYGSSVSIDPEFRVHVSEKNYNNAVFHENEGASFITAVAQLADEGYILQIKYDASALMSIAEGTSISSAAIHFPLYSEGDTALIDEETMTYVSHSSKSRIGLECSVDPELFRRNKSKFDVNLSGDTVMVRYHKYEDYIIAAFVSYDDIFQTSYAVFGWMIGGGVAILTVAALAMRMATIRELRRCVSEQNKAIS